MITCTPDTIVQYAETSPIFAGRVRRTQEGLTYVLVFQPYAFLLHLQPVDAAAGDWVCDGWMATIGTDRELALLAVQVAELTDEPVFHEELNIVEYALSLPYHYDDASWPDRVDSAALNMFRSAAIRNADKRKVV